MKKVAIDSAPVALSLRMDLAAIITKHLAMRDVTFRQIAEVCFALGIKVEFTTEPPTRKKPKRSKVCQQERGGAR